MQDEYRRLIKHYLPTITKDIKRLHDAETVDSDIRRPAKVLLALSRLGWMLQLP